MMRYQRIVPRLYQQRRAYQQSWSKSRIPAASLAGAAVAASLLSTNEEETSNSASSNEPQSSLPFGGPLSPTTTACDFLFLPSSTGSKANKTTTVAQKQTSRKRNKTMALIESFSTHRDDENAEPVAATAIPSGTNLTVDSKYAVDWNQPLGVGAFGGVFAAEDRVTGRKVAIKQIPKHCTEYASFQREMEALAQIARAGGHPNINSLRETFVGSHDDDNYYLVLDLLAGKEVFDQLCDAGTYSEADAARLIRQVASALAFLHDLGIVHSDLKPENLMLTSKNPNNAVVQLVDFGCARYVPESIPSESVSRDSNRQADPSSPMASTPAYCPPEVFGCKRCKDIVPSFDMWSLGVIVFALLTGTHPFDLENDASNQELERRIVEGEMPNLDGKEYSFLSDDAKDVILGLMNMEPEKRWTACQVLEHPWVQGKTAKSRKIEQSDFKLMTYRRHKTAVLQKVFQTMLIQSAVSEVANDNETRTNVCLLEAAFRQLDQKNLGYISTKEMHGDTRWYMADAQLSFSELSDVLSDTISNLYLPTGHILYTEGDKGDVMFFLNSGRVEVTSSEGIVQERVAGEFFGEEVARTEDGSNPGYKNTVQCKTPVHVFAVPRDCFEKYMKADASVALTMAETDRLRNRERSRAMLGLNKNMREKTYKQDEVLFEQGMKGSNLYLVKEGDVDIYRDGFKVRTLKKGEMTGEHAAFYHKKNYNVTAKCVGESCKIGILKGKDMHALFRNNPSLQSSFHDIILRRDFKKAICASTRRKFPETEEELRASFDDIACRAETLELADLRRLMLDFDPTYTEQDIHSLLKSMDLNNSGNVTWEEFKVAYGMAREA
mmetsp:Transcript_7856/g.12467  ORF Transcript_7856/g.12467 Transcript_7856/m.12467 type:complete len:836 (-) Transcript_7856:441-2948(-)|eukprot:CAMPEP_0178834950 /NCGR_PEP_ID=MMETSP0746-20121128/11364_1 /TAXON_ID=913974 /ORGANISM="Nitzschia punctata, Strain CCMP561" /LENGTH=835 /DNA_ID=CAMNT_0020497487 /DNA_START=110 /DNA_END=2617 /DNA_ORIENTATION=-